jgi:hypothetical protein
MNSYFRENNIPELQTRVSISLNDNLKSVGLTNPAPVFETLPKTSLKESELNETSWSSMVIELDFESITNLLMNYERDFGFSTIEMFLRYKNGEFANDPNIDYWINTYILYLGTKQIRQYSSP